ncbi:MAG: hypothetical protein DRH56_03780 [Deltaproteobacteria bacterium]|nr:MAG: hypothetical protein DRH56_03780 [Deltaproteobacteria bacterium]
MSRDRQLFAARCRCRAPAPAVKRKGAAFLLDERLYLNGLKLFLLYQIRRFIKHKIPGRHFRPSPRKNGPAAVQGNALRKFS